MELKDQLVRHHKLLYGDIDEVVEKYMDGKMVFQKTKNLYMDFEKVTDNNFDRDLAFHMNQDMYEDLICDEETKTEDNARRIRNGQNSSSKPLLQYNLFVYRKKW